MLTVKLNSCLKKNLSIIKRSKFCLVVCCSFLSEPTFTGLITDI